MVESPGLMRHRRGGAEDGGLLTFVPVADSLHTPIPSGPSMPTFSMPYRPALLALGFLAASGCSLMTETVCTAEARPALLVDVRDSLTNAPAGQGARIIARTGTFADTAQGVDFYAGAYGLAPESPGTYTVTVEKEGYLPWTRSGIEVTRGECHVHTVEVTARLQR